MPKYDDWFKGFLSGKTEIPPVESSDKFAAHSIRRFLDGKDLVWEIAITYTGRLVMRSGRIGSDGITVEWKDWVTQHNVEMPKSGS